MNRVVWGLDDTRLTSRGLAVAIDPATWLTRPQGLSTADLAEPDIQVLDNTILVRSAHGFSTDLLLSDLAECSIGTREVWGAHGYHRIDVINVGSHDDRTLQRECDSVRIVGYADHPLARADEHFPIYYCQGLRMDATEVWPKTKKRD